MTTFYMIFNGPPRSGKSTLARVAVRKLSRLNINVHSDSFAAPIKQFMATLHGVPYSSLAKDRVSDVLGVTPREAMMELSERYLKNVYGKDLLGRALVYRSSKGHSSSIHRVVVLDSAGFSDETDLVPRDDSVLIRVFRPGYNFDSDSRGYIPNPNRTIINDAGLDKAISITEEIVDCAIDKWRLR